VSEENRAVAVAYLDAITRNDLDRFDEYLHPEVEVPPAFAAFGSGIAAFKVMFGGLHKSLGDLLIVPEETVAEGDTVVARITVSGIHIGAAFGLDVPPTGKRVSFDEALFLRFRDGKIHSIESVIDRLVLMQEVGAIELKTGA
jgi:predicted ester cyclase